MTIDWLARFREAGAVQEGHFLLSSGLHASTYVQSALILQDPDQAAALGEVLADRVRPLRPQLVVSPALGGIVIAHEVARALGARAIFAERTDGRMALRRGFIIASGERTLVVEDVVTTGGTTNEVVDLARAAGGEVVGVAALIDRSGGHLTVEVPLRAVLTLTLPVFASSECRLCAQGVPLVKPGSRQALRCTAYQRKDEHS